MFIMLAVFLLENPYDGLFSKKDGYDNEDIRHNIFLCIFYVILTLWFLSLVWGKKVKSKIYIIGVAISLLGATSQVIACSLDYETYEAEMEKFYNGDSWEKYSDDYEVFEEYYPLKQSATRTLFAGFAFMSYIVLVGLLCKRSRNTIAKIALFATLALFVFNIISNYLPLRIPEWEWESYRDVKDYYKSRENIKFVGQGLLYLSMAVSMLLYKDFESEDSATVEEVATSVEEPAAPIEKAAAHVEEPADMAEESDETVIEILHEEGGETAVRTGTLTSGTALQSGRYIINLVLGQGGFGVTYLATQTGLNRKVAIKEFFMKEYCDRDTVSNHITLGTAGSKDMVAKFKAKFIKEAQTIAELQNQHVVRIYDIFEENGTAYYVMEYIEGGSLAKKVIGHPMDNATANKFMKQLCQALEYIHNRNILHLDIKPSNILFRNENELVLIDFGVSKHYDEDGGSQTSSTPVGISRGYAPLEQYNKGGVIQFSPATDIYSLGATLYSIVTGQTPPDANEIYEDGIDDFPAGVSQAIQNAVIKAMDPRRKQRPQSISEFTQILNS